MTAKTIARASHKQRRTDVARLPLRWAMKSRTREGELYRRVCRDLRKHLGGRPTATQEMLIGRIAWLQVHLSRLDQRALEAEELSEHAGKQYLAWANSLSRMLQALGLEAASPKSMTSADALRILRDEYGVGMAAE